MPRVVIDRPGDIRLSRGHFKNFPVAGPDPLVVSDREAQMVVAAGLGRIVETEGKALPMPTTKKKKAPPVADAAPKEPEADGK